MKGKETSKGSIKITERGERGGKRQKLQKTSTRTKDLDKTFLTDTQDHKGKGSLRQKCRKKKKSPWPIRKRTVKKRYEDKAWKNRYKQKRR